MNTSWYSKDVGDGIAAQGPSQQLFSAFEALILRMRPASGFGVFSLYDLRSNVVTWYFSPEAEFLANAFGATPCEKPTPTRGFALLVGSQSSVREHFPQYVPGQ